MLLMLNHIFSKTLLCNPIYKVKEMTILTIHSPFISKKKVALNVLVDLIEQQERKIVVFRN
jgi:hypothetical protein